MLDWLPDAPLLDDPELEDPLLVFEGVEVLLRLVEDAMLEELAPLDCVEDAPVPLALEEALLEILLELDVMLVCPVPVESGELEGLLVDEIALLLLAVKDDVIEMLALVDKWLELEDLIVVAFVGGTKIPVEFRPKVVECKLLWELTRTEHAKRART